MTTRREFVQIAGATAASAALAKVASAQGAQVAADRAAALDHVVVVMFENRAFDNLLGRLYAPGEVAAFEGVLDHGADRKFVPYGVAANMNTPSPAPARSIPTSAPTSSGSRTRRTVSAVGEDGGAVERPRAGAAAHHGRLLDGLHHHARWSLGAPFTARDAIARDIAPVLSLDAPRDPEDWPEVAPRPAPKFDAALLPPDRPLSIPGDGLLRAALEFEKSLGAKVPTIPRDAVITGAQAVDMMRDGGFDIFPGLRA